MQVHHKFWKYVQHREGRFVGRMIALVFVLLFLGATFGVHIPGAQAKAAPQGGSGIVGMIDQVFGPYRPAAVRVAQCESGLNPGATNPVSIGGSHAAGLFQVLYPSTWGGTSEAASSPYNAWANIVAAHQIFVRDGYSWREWTCQP